MTTPIRLIPVLVSFFALAPTLANDHPSAPASVFGPSVTVSPSGPSATASVFGPSVTVSPNGPSATASVSGPSAPVSVAPADAASAWRDVPLKSRVTTVQPGTGLVLWSAQARNYHKTHGDVFTLEFSYVMPDALVLGRDGDELLYDWTPLETLLEGVASRGHQLVLRFPLCYPRNTDNREGGKDKRGGTYVPAYIKSLPGYEETFSPNPGGDGPTWYPDWRSEELRWFVRRFYEDFARRYGSDPRIAFLEVGFGHWAEDHIHGTDLALGVNFPDMDWQRDFLRFLADTMPIPWLISVDAANAERTPVRNDPAVRALAFGLFDDTFMHARHEISQGSGWNERCWQGCGMDRWQSGVCGCEISYYTKQDQLCFLDPKGLYGVTWEEAAAKYHMTFVICSDAPNGDFFTRDRVREAGMASGYHFRVLACRTDGARSEIEIANEGVAPIYRDAWIAVGGVRAAESLRGLLPGDRRVFAVAAAAEPGNVAIVSDAILPSQRIEFDAD